MAAPFARGRGLRAAALALVACLDASTAVPGRTPAVFAAGRQRGNQAGPRQNRPPDFEAMARQQADDRSDLARRERRGSWSMEKIVYRSRLGDLEIPAFRVPAADDCAARRRHPALVWVHENIRGHLYEHYIPYIRGGSREGLRRDRARVPGQHRVRQGVLRRDRLRRGRGRRRGDGGERAATSASPQVDPARIGIIGWSHGGLITLLAVFRNPTTFKAAAAIVPVTNLFQRLAWKGVERQPPGDRSAQSLRRTAVGAARGLQGPFAALSGGQAADSPARPRRGQRSRT